MPIFAAKVLNVGPAALGNLVLAAGCGSLAGSLAVVAFGPRFDQRKIAIASGVVAALTANRFRGVILVSDFDRADNAYFYGDDRVHG